MYIQGIFKDKRVQTASISFISFAGGIALGYVLAKRRLRRNVIVVGAESKLFDDYVKTKPVTIVEETVTVIPLILAPDPEFERLLDEEERIEREANERVHEVHNTVVQQDRIVTDQEPTAEARVRAITNHDSRWVYDDELSTRTKEEPYIIHEEEYIADEMNFHQDTLTYYAGDDIMADSDDTPIYNYQGLMGELKFGHGSTSPDVVYIRNEGLHIEWEIVLHQGSFSEEVLGLEMETNAEEELHHSVLKFRQE
jgi:hypothetical protein